jgi:hypothetical protein
VDDSIGIGIFCGDFSECDIDRNLISKVALDLESSDGTRQGFGIVAHYGAKARVRDNVLLDSPGGVGAFADARITEE